MSFASALVLYAVLWFLTFLVAIPVRLVAQGDTGQVTPGTPASAPERHGLRRKAVITTLVAAILWGIIAGVIISGQVGIRDIDLFGRMGSAPPAE